MAVSVWLFGWLAAGCWCSGNYWNCARLLIRPVYKAITGMAMAVAMSMAMPTKCNQSQVKVKGVAAILTQKVCFKLALVEANTLFMAQSQPILKKYILCTGGWAIVFHSSQPVKVNSERQTFGRVSLDLSRRHTKKLFTRKAMNAADSRLRTDDFGSKSITDC